MNDRNKSIIAKDWILKLANGINPLDGSAIPDGDIVNNGDTCKLPWHNVT